MGTFKRWAGVLIIILQLLSCRNFIRQTKFPPKKVVLEGVFSGTVWLERGWSLPVPQEDGWLLPAQLLEVPGCGAEWAGGAVLPLRCTTAPM